MHVVIWTIAGQRYATPTSAVVEVIPAVDARPGPQAAPWVKGLFNYRGKLLPLLDATLLLGQTPSDVRMTARILVIRTDGFTKGNDENLVGILVERVLGSEQVDFEDRSGHASVHASDARFLGPVAVTPDGTVQLIESSGIPVL